MYFYARYARIRAEDLIHFPNYMHHKNLYWIVVLSLVAGFFLGKFLDFGGAEIQASVIRSADIEAKNPEQDEAYEQGKAWLDTYEISPQKIADQASR